MVSERFNSGFALMAIEVFGVQCRLQFRQLLFSFGLAEFCAIGVGAFCLIITRFLFAGVAQIDEVSHLSWPWQHRLWFAPACRQTDSQA